ncbi:MAG: hypothetical protein Kow00124_24950 [Anaerolineae bacterium]
MANPSPNRNARERVSFGTRIIYLIGGWGERLSTFGRWLNNPPDLPGVYARIGVVGSLFLAAISVTVTLCIVAYWITLGVQYARCLGAASGGC